MEASTPGRHGTSASGRLPTIAEPPGHGHYWVRCGQASAGSRACVAPLITTEPQPRSFASSSAWPVANVDAGGGGGRARPMLGHSTAHMGPTLGAAWGVAVHAAPHGAAAHASGVATRGPCCPSTSGTTSGGAWAAEGRPASHMAWRAATRGLRSIACQPAAVGASSRGPVGGGHRPQIATLIRAYAVAATPRGASAMAGGSGRHGTTAVVGAAGRWAAALRSGLASSPIRAAAAVVLPGGLAAAGGLRFCLARQLHCSRQQQYVRSYVQHYKNGVTEVQPYWAALQADMACVYQSAFQWLPSLPGIARFHVPVLSALNTVGPYLPRTLALALFEAMRNTREARALSFESSLDCAETAAARPGFASYGVAHWVLASTASAVTTLWHSLRLSWLLLVFTPLLLAAPLALGAGLLRKEWYVLLRRTLEVAGAFFIKWGQWSATRHDIFPPDMCTALAQLHTQAPAHTFRQSRAVLEGAFGMPLSDIFDTIEPEPVASGSIGQIHRATLSRKGAAITGCQPGQVVAVKVRHPGCAETILHDFETMMWVAALASGLPAVRGLRLQETLSQFAAPLKEQVDLAREASNLQRFNYNFRNTDHVRFPVPLYPLVSADVLVESFEEGDHITRYIEEVGNPYNHRLSELGSGTMLQMMLVDNLIHSDLHPGNILVRLNPPTGLLGLCYKALDRAQASERIDAPTRERIHALQRRWLQPQIVLLDVGMTTEMSGDDQANMVGLFRSFSRMDGRACGEWTLRFSGDVQSCPDPEGFKADMALKFDILRRAEEADAEASHADGTMFRNTAEALASVLELIRVHEVTLPGHICAVVVTTLVLEGWSNKLDPDHSVLMQVQKMFEGVNVPWRERINHVVDWCVDEEQHTALV